MQSKQRPVECCKRASTINMTGEHTCSTHKMLMLMQPKLEMMKEIGYLMNSASNKFLTIISLRTKNLIEPVLFMKYKKLAFL